MNMKLSLIALAVMSAGTAQAASFNLNEANLEKLNTSKWACKRCVVEQQVGTVGVSAIAVDAEDVAAANYFGEEDGFAAAVQADVDSRKDGSRVQLDANNFGAETGRIEAKFSNDRFALRGGYQSNLHVNADNAQTAFAIRDGVISNDSLTRAETLELKRENYFVGAGINGELLGNQWRGFIDYTLADKSGQQVKSSQFIGLPDANDGTMPINYVAPIDHTTQTLVAGGEMIGERWLAGVKYQGSQFENDHNGINAVAGGSIQSFEPENEAHQMIVNGQYRFDRHSLSSRVVKGWMYQDQDFTTTAGVPNGIHSADAEVQTLDVNARWNHRASSDLRIKAKVDYRDRDNQTPVRLFESIDYDPTQGRAVENVALDSTRIAYQLQADYRLMKGAKAVAGYQRIDKEQTDSVKEETSENRFFAGLRYDRLTNWDFSFDAEYSSRDGSDYQADAATSDEDNAALRKYHLADRDRSEFTFGVNHEPLENLSIDAKVRYALDDYSSTEIGLTESRDSGYDISVNYQPMAKLNLHLFASQQWIDSEQNDLNAAGQYQGEINDSFSHIGFGGAYHGLLQDKMTIGLDYGFSESDSDTEVNTSVYGDYFAWSHNVDLYAQYQISAKASVKANYGYERYYDTDYGSVNSSSYTTLGNLNNNYVAHMVMLTFSYSL